MSGLVPKLRFKQGDGSDFPVWEEKRLGDVAICLDHKRKPLNSSERLVMQGDVPYYGANGIVDYIDNYIFNEPLILLAEDGGNFESFDTRPIAQNIQGKSWVNNHAHILKTKKITNHDYLFYSLVHKDIRKFINGSSRSKLNKSDMLIIPIPLPSLPEQQKIADFLSSIDAKIDTVKRKRDAFERYKKGLMQQIFAQKIRFKQEDGSDFPEWEEKRLGSLCSIKTGKLDANAMVSNGAFPFFTCAREVYRIDEFAFDTDALLISGNGANVGYIHQYNGKFNAYQRTYILSDFIDIYKIFLFYFLEKQLKARIYTEAKEGNTPYIVMGTLTDMCIDIPSLPEQQKIADFLSSVDAKIDAIKRQVEKLEAFKKGLLQQMFV